MQLDRQDARVISKIRVGCENGPATVQGDRANQDIHNRSDNSFGPAVITRPCGSFIIRGINWLVEKSSQSGTKLFELRRRFDSGEQFLSNESDDASAAFPNQFGQFGDQCSFDAA